VIELILNIPLIISPPFFYLAQFLQRCFCMHPFPKARLKQWQDKMSRVTKERDAKNA
jgi:hypothetical protein